MKGILVLAFGLIAFTSACQKNDQANFTDFQLALDEAVEAQDTDKVFDLICPHQPMVMDYQKHEIELVERLRAFLHSRYESEFVPPANADALCGVLGWSNAFFLSQYNDDGVASVHAQGGTDGRPSSHNEDASTIPCPGVVPAA